MSAGLGKIATAIVIASMVIGASLMSASGVNALSLWIFWMLTIVAIFCGKYGMNDE